MTIGDKILNMRKARGWSQEELADRLGVTRQAVSRWESGSAKPDADKILAVSDLFGVSADYLLRDRYAGEGELRSDPDPAPTSTPTSAPTAKIHQSLTSWQILGIMMIVMGFLLFAVLCLMSMTKPHGYIINGRSYGILDGYIVDNDLWWMVITAVVSALSGAVLLVGRPKSKKKKDHENKDAS